MSGYSEGLRHGWEDAEKAIRDILARDITDAEKLQRIQRRVEAPVIGLKRPGDPARERCAS